MNKSSLSLTLIIACLLGSAYACSDDKDIETPQETKCVSSICKDDNTLYVCDPATNLRHEEPCANGCSRSTNRCKDIEPDSSKIQCTSDICKDDYTLYACHPTTGILNETPCEYGCDRATNRCKDTGMKCIASLCKDDTMLYACDTSTGTVHETPCEYGCDKTTSQCKDKSIAEKCTSSKCKNDTILLVCNPTSGKYIETKCDLGCQNDACVHEDICVPICKTDDVAIVCHEDGSSEEQNCPKGCNKATGKCHSDSIIGESCNTETAPKCEGNDLIYCAETAGKTVWTRLSCPNHYECKVYEEQAMCLETCTKSGETGTICGSGFLVGSVCSKLDTQLYYLPDYETGILDSCEFGCMDNHVCMNTPCDESFTEKCSGEKDYIYCESGTMVSGTCEEGKSCFISSDQKAKCGYTCNPDSALSKRCYYQYPDNPDSGQSNYANVKCQKGDTSYGYEIMSYDKCPGKCTDDKGCL